jgi:hypothetical protein
MSTAMNITRSAIVLLGVTLVSPLPAIGEDFATWSDREVNAALAEARHLLAPQMNTAGPIQCPGIGLGDTASAIDCDVNKSLNAGSVPTATLVASPQ